MKSFIASLLNLSDDTAEYVLWFIGGLIGGRVFYAVSKFDLSPEGQSLKWVAY